METAWGLFQQGERGMWFLCLHDSAVRFSGCARNVFYALTYAEINVDSHTRSKTPWLIVFRTAIAATCQSGTTSQQRQHRLKGGASRP